jgi:hypothetical protein
VANLHPRGYDHYVTTLPVAFGGILAVGVVALVATGHLFPRYVVDRIIMIYAEELRQERRDCDYYRNAARDCAATMATQEARIKTLELQLEQRGGSPE